MVVFKTGKCFAVNCFFSGPISSERERHFQFSAFIVGHFIRWTIFKDSERSSLRYDTPIYRTVRNFLSKYCQPWQQRDRHEMTKYRFKKRWNGQKERHKPQTASRDLFWHFSCFYFNPLLTWHSGLFRVLRWSPRPPRSMGSKPIIHKTRLVQ